MFCLKESQSECILMWSVSYIAYNCFSLGGVRVKTYAGTQIYTTWVVHMYFVPVKLFISETKGKHTKKKRFGNI